MLFLVFNDRDADPALACVRLARRTGVLAKALAPGQERKNADVILQAEF